MPSLASLGLSGAEQRAYEDALGATGKPRVRAALQSIEGDEIADLSDRLVDGQVNIDSTAEVTRQATLVVDDPTHALHLDADAPAEGAMFADRLVQITYGLWVDGIGDDGKWVDVPVFTGPIAAMSRDGSSVELSCLGKEHLARGNAWRSLDIKKGANTLDAIRRILKERGGETKFDFPESGALTRKTLADHVSLSRLSVPWDEALHLAGSINAQLFYDGRGRCVLRDDGVSGAWTFRDGNGGTVLSPPDVAWDLDNLVNAVFVKGKKPSGKDGKDKDDETKKHKGAKKAVTATAVAGRNHPLSPYKLGRNGVPRYLAVEVENDKLATKADVQRAAENALAASLEQGVTVSFDALPIPHLDVGDKVKLKANDLTLDFTFRTASLPLVHSGVMSVGAVKRVTPSLTSIRGRRGGK